MCGVYLSGLVETLLGIHWEIVKDAPWAARHPCFTSHEKLRQWIIPLRFHGDDASIKTIHGRKLCIISFHSEFASMDAATSRMLSWVCYDDYLIPGVTLPQFTSILRWSFDCLLSGVYPSHDHRGNLFPTESHRSRLAKTLIAGGLRFAFQGSLGDWSWHSKLYYPLLHGSSHNFICGRDCAARHMLFATRYQDIGPDAGRSEIRSTTCMQGIYSLGNRALTVCTTEQHSSQRWL